MAKPKPALSLLDRAFKYRDSASTDVRRTFQRVRRAQRQAEKAPSSSVVRIKTRRAS